MKPHVKTPGIIVVFGCLYFGFAPFAPLRNFVIGPTNVVNYLAAVFLAALLVLHMSRRVWQSAVWYIPSGLFLGSWAFGLVRSPEYALPSALQWTGRFVVLWLLVSLLPLDRRFLRSLCIAWFVGLCSVALWQLVMVSRTGLQADATSQYSQSRLLQTSHETQLAADLGVLNTYGCSAMSIAGSCALAFALAAREKRARLVLLIAAALLFYTEWRGRFMTSDILAFAGILLGVGFATVRTGAKIQAALMGLAALALVAVLGITVASQVENETWKRATSLWAEGVGGDLSFANRFSYLGLSLDTWFAHPFFGVGVLGWCDESWPTIGGHSSLVDLPAQVGIMGVLGYFSLMIFPMKRAITTLRQRAFSPVDRDDAMLVSIGMPLLIVAAVFNPASMMPFLSETLLLLAALGTTLPKKGPGRMRNPSRWRPPQSAAGAVEAEAAGSHAPANQEMRGTVSLS